jgi:predicted 3-demethylubiquinone-9 3-methyltransferase (glyoxalase superfamily)
MDTITPTLWINDNRIEEAAAFYTSLFEDGEVTGSNDYGPEAGEYAGQKMVIRLKLNDQPFVLLNGAATSFAPNESVSFEIGCEDQEEVDRLWHALEDGGEPGPCGWIKDRFGFSWQVTPTALYRMMDDPDPERVRRVTQCFMAVDKRQFDIAELEAAYEGP